MAKKRSKFFGVRLYEEEYTQVLSDAQRAGLDKSTYGRHVLLDAPIPKQARVSGVDAEVLRKLLGHIGKIGSNLNQIAAYAHSTRTMRGMEVALLEELQALKRLRLDIRTAMGRKEPAPTEAVPPTVQTVMEQEMATNDH